VARSRRPPTDQQQSQAVKTDRGSTTHGPDAGPRASLRAWAKDDPRRGFRPAHIDARAEGWNVNHMKIQRVWRDEGLRVPQRRRRKRPADAQRVGQTGVGFVVSADGFEPEAQNLVRITNFPVTLPSTPADQGEQRQLSRIRIRRWRACTNKSEPGRTGLQSPCKRAVVSSILTGGSARNTLLAAKTWLSRTESVFDWPARCHEGVINRLQLRWTLARRSTRHAWIGTRISASAGYQALRCLRWVAKKSAHDATSGCCLSRARR
jgi:hypothetical protein